MKLFTPIINFDIDEQVNWLKISKCKIKKISSKDIADYFGAKIIRDGNFHPIQMTSLKDPPTPQYLRYQSPGILNELQNIQLLRCKYAFVSSLKIDKHREEIGHILDAFRLHKINGITCPVTFDTGIAQYFTYPLDSKLKQSTKFTKEEIKKIEKFLPTLSQFDAEDLKLLNNVMENGISILSIVFLMIIMERCLLRGIRSEISFKVRIFTAKYLSEYYNYQPNKVFGNVRSAYNLRSDFVHGGKKIKKNEIDKIFSDIYDYTIKLLRLKAKSPQLFDDQKRNSLLF